MLHLYSKSCPIAQSSTPACTQTSTRKETLSVATGGVSSDRRHVNLTYCAWHHALSWHQVVIEALQATVQGVGDSPLVVVQGGVRSLRSERTPWCLLNEEGGDVRIIPAFTRSQFCCCTVAYRLFSGIILINLCRFHNVLWDLFVRSCGSSYGQQSLLFIIAVLTSCTTCEAL